MKLHSPTAFLPLELSSIMQIIAAWSRGGKGSHERVSAGKTISNHQYRFEFYSASASVSNKINLF